MKRIILCSDGTGNHGGKGRGTNVWKTYKAVDRHGHETGRGLEQLAIYDDGVGTSDFKIFKAIGGAMGWGLSRNICDLYTALARSYEPGDILYLFGFSRGAFTVRSLAGMISRCGVIDRDKLAGKSLEDRVAQAYQLYREEESHSEEFKKTFAVMDSEHAPNGVVPIHFVGVWDTVDAIGVPFDWMRKTIYAVARRVRRPHDHDVNPQMAHGYHALALDDERQTFDPVMWDEHKTAAHQQIEQVWFAGVHSNIGGGYPKQGMSAVTLDWMMEKASTTESAAGSERGLRFIESERTQAREEADVHAKLYDSRSGLAAYYRYRPRLVDVLSKVYCKGEPKIHDTVFNRVERATDAYAPEVVPIDFEVMATDHGQTEYATAVAASLGEHRGLRLAVQSELQSKTKTRVVLYYVFIGLTLAVTGLATYFRVSPHIDAWPEFAGLLPAFNEMLRNPPTGSSWALKIPSFFYNAVPWLVNGLLPASWETVVDGLFDRADIVLGVSGLLGGLLFWRQRLKRAMKRLSLKTWKSVFDAAQAKAEDDT